MGTKRKAPQIPLPTEPRRSRRNVEKSDVVEQIEKAMKLNGDEAKVASSKGKTVARSTGLPTIGGQISTAKSVKKAIIGSDTELDKEIIPIRTYGKMKSPTSVITTTQLPKVDVSKNRSGRLVDKFCAVEKKIPKIVDKTIKKKTIDVIKKKKGNLTINSPTKIEVRTTTTNSNAKPVQTASVINNTAEAGTQKKIIINKIIMPPDAYNQIMLKQTPNQSPNKSSTSKTTSTTNNAPITTQVPVQHLINNLQTNLGPILLSSGIKVIPNSQQSTVLTAANVLPINQIAQVTNQLNNKNANLRIVTTLPNQQMINAPGGLKQLQLPIIIKSIANPVSVQQPAVSTQAKTTIAQVKGTTNANSVNKVNPISSVKAPNVNKTPERVVVNIDANKRDRAKKSRVSFNFDKNTSTNIKPITNELPIAASNVLMTSTPKQSIIKKSNYVFPCTPTPINLNKRLVRTVTSTVKPLVTTTNEPPTIAQQIKSKIETVRNNYSNSPSPISVKYCKQSQCDCWSNLPKDDLEQVKRVFSALNAPKRMLYIYCTTIKINDDAKFDFEKYVFYVRTKNGFVQVCHRVYMEIFEKQNLSFVETAFKKCDV